MTNEVRISEYFWVFLLLISKSTHVLPSFHSIHFLDRKRKVLPSHHFVLLLPGFLNSFSSDNFLDLFFPIENWIRVSTYEIDGLVDTLGRRHSRYPRHTLKILASFYVILIKMRQLWEGSDRNVACPALWNMVRTDMAYRNLCTSVSLGTHIQPGCQTERWDLWSHLEMAEPSCLLQSPDVGRSSEQRAGHIFLE